MKSEFIYHAHAVALSGRLVSPVRAVLEAQAAVALSESGGVSNAQVENVQFQDALYCAAAWSQAAGVENVDKPGTYSTVVTSVIEGLNILDMVTADRIVMRITSKHSGDGEPTIGFSGSTFENLRVGGQPVDVELDTATFNELGTYSKFRGRYQKDGGFQSDLDRRLMRGALDQIPREKYRTINYFEKFSGDAFKRRFDSGKEIRCSLAKGIRCASADIKAYGNTIEIPEFGLLRLAEVTIGEDLRKLTMVRLNLGCVYEGDFDGGSGAGNGNPWPA